MKSLDDQVLSYAAYHGDMRNKITHFFGVPLVTYSVFLFFSWFRLSFSDLDTHLSGATLFYLCVFIYYLFLDWKIALLQAPFSLLLLWLADVAALQPFAVSLSIFAVAFVGGWIIQLVGHYFEGKRPALADNFTQIFNAPLFLTVEILFWFGLRKDLREKAEGTRALSPAPAEPALATSS
jgi:uncharacterized membrane protein YGL010W